MRVAFLKHQILFISLVLSAVLLPANETTFASSKKARAIVTKDAEPMPKEVAGAVIPGQEGDVDPMQQDDSLSYKLVADQNSNQNSNQNAGQVDPIAEAGTGAAAGAAAAAAQPKIDVNKAAESEIPVLANSKDVKRATGGEFSRILITLGVLAALLGGASYGLRRWAAKSGGKNNQNTRIRVLTQHYLGPKKSLAIVQVAGESLLIGVTDQNISMLKTLSLIDDEVPEAVPQNFDTALEDYEEMQQYEVGEKSKRKSRKGEDFAMQGVSDIRDVVTSRLKNMRNL